MPCHDYEYDADRLETERMQKRCDKLTAMLCHMCRTLEKNSVMDWFSDELQCWWELHKKLDSLRIAATK